MYLYGASVCDTEHMSNHACGNEWEREHVTNCLPLAFTQFQHTENNFELSN